jgi:hypothetical protein
MEIKKIYELCPSITKMTLTEEYDSLVRMCIAHVLNGGAYNGIFITALSYLESLEN